MASTLIGINNTATDAPFRTSIRAAIANAAQAVLAENAGTANHAARLVWAKAALKDTAGQVEQFAWAVAAVNTITTASTDAQIQNQVNLLIDTFAA